MNRVYRLIREAVAIVMDLAALVRLSILLILHPAEADRVAHEMGGDGRDRDE